MYRNAHLEDSYYSGKTGLGVRPFKCVAIQVLITEGCGQRTIHEQRFRNRGGHRREVALPGSYQGIVVFAVYLFLGVCPFAYRG